MSEETKDGIFATTAAERDAAYVSPSQEAYGSAREQPPAPQTVAFEHEPAPQPQPQAAPQPAPGPQQPPAPGLQPQPPYGAYAARPQQPQQPQQPMGYQPQPQPLYPAPLLRLTGGMKFGWLVVGFLSGIPGILVAWLANVNSMPSVKSDAMKFAAIGFLIQIVLAILAVVIAGGVATAALSGMVASSSSSSTYMYY